MVFTYDTPSYLFFISLCVLHSCEYLLGINAQIGNPGCGDGIVTNERDFLDATILLHANPFAAAVPIISESLTMSTISRGGRAASYVINEK